MTRERFLDLDGQTIAIYDSRRPEGYEIVKKRLADAVEEGRINPTRLNAEYARLDLAAGKTTGNPIDNVYPAKSEDILLDAITNDPKVMKRIYADIQRMKRTPTKVEGQLSNISRIERVIEKLESQRQVYQTTQEYLAQIRRAA